MSIICNQSYAQKCKETVDAISNEKKVEFIQGRAGIVGWGDVSYVAKNGVVTLTKDFIYTGAINLVAPAGSEVFFKLENGEIIKLKTNSDAGPKMYPSAYGVTTGYTFVMNVSKADLNKFAASPLVLIRIPKVNAEGFMDLDKKDRYVKKSKDALMKGAACISASAQ